MKSTVFIFALILLSGALLDQLQDGGPLPRTSAPVSERTQVRVVVDEEPVVRKSPEILSFSEVVQRVNPSVVNIYTTRRVEVRRSPSPFDDPFFRRFFGEPFPGGREQAPRSFEQQGLGSGVIVTSDGYILTNHHVIDGASEIRVKMMDNGAEHVARLIGSDQGTDIAVLKIEGENLPSLPFADSDSLEVGDLVLAVGNPFGLGHTVTMGIVSALGRADVGIVDYENFIQTDASINPGNSGGALVNSQGELVGINTAILSRTGGNLGIGFAVPVNLARSIMDSLLAHGEVVRGFLGVSLQAITPELSEALGLASQRGVLVNDITPDSPADVAGLKQGDVILRFRQTRVDTPRQLRLAVGSTLPGTEVTLEILREGEVRSIPVTLVALPDQEGPLGRLDDTSFSALSGLHVREISEEDRTNFNLPANLSGAIIERVEEGSVAARVGLQPGFVILEINRQRVHSAREALEISRRIDQDTRILLLVRTPRGNQFVVLPREAEMSR